VIRSVRIDEFDMTTEDVSHAHREDWTGPHF
jgi:hypothetical protein